MDMWEIRFWHDQAIWVLEEERKKT